MNHAQINSFPISKEHATKHMHIDSSIQSFIQIAIELLYLYFAEAQMYVQGRCLIYTFTPRGLPCTQQYVTVNGITAIAYQS